MKFGMKSGCRLYNCSLSRVGVIWVSVLEVSVIRRERSGIVAIFGTCVMIIVLSEWVNLEQSNSKRGHIITESTSRAAPAMARLPAAELKVEYMVA